MKRFSRVLAMLLVLVMVLTACFVAGCTPKDDGNTSDCKVTFMVEGEQYGAVKRW